MNELMDEAIDKTIQEAVTKSFLSQNIAVEITLDQACYLMAAIDVTLKQNEKWRENNKDADEATIKQIDKCKDELLKVHHQLEDKTAPEKVGL